jgi:hypothetical protein
MEVLLIAIALQIFSEIAAFVSSRSPRAATRFGAGSSVIALALQQGVVHVYLIYIMVTVVLALAWVSLRTWWGPS